MANVRTTIDKVDKQTAYAQAFTIEGVARPTTSEEINLQRTVVTSFTKGVISLRYAPRPPKPSESVNTDS